MPWNFAYRPHYNPVMPTSRILGALSLLATMFLPAAASAQFATRTERAAPVAYDQILSINPLLLVFQGYVSADYERRLATSTTLGLSLSSFDLSDANYLAIEAKARYYVTGRAFDGVSIGAVSGLVRLSEDSTNVKDYALSIGFNAERQWLVGTEERLALTAGLGATRLFFAEDRPAFRQVLPILRLSIGWGF
jgi:hypothetical protein